MKIKIWRRRWRYGRELYAWHWWCPCCVGGNWHSTWARAAQDVRRHLTEVHS